MANNHGFIIGTHCAFWDVDSKNFVGIAESDIDNGTFVALGDILNTSGVIDEYVFAVSAASASDFVVATPPVGDSLEMQLFDDPRYFYNKAGKPMSVKHLEIGDCIEVDDACFSTAPTLGTSTYAGVTSGKLVASTTASDPFKILGQHNVDIGGVSVPTWVLMKVA